MWYNVVSQRKCVVNNTIQDIDPDSTCLPNERCVNGECRRQVKNYNIALKSFDLKRCFEIRNFKRKMIDLVMNL